MTIMAQNIGLIETTARLLSKKPPEKEIIHSGHFMVSNFEAEAQDDEDVFASNPEMGLTKRETSSVSNLGLGVISNSSNATNVPGTTSVQRTIANQQISIETSLTKLFQCMSLAYRQKLTSPKWNRFKGIRLRWKDKIRLNNVIWRCWHMQFITKKNALVCQFASPLDVDTHNKPEAIVLEGKYWKRKLNAVTTEYKKWRLFHRNRILGWSTRDGPDDPADMLAELEMLEWQPHSDDCHMMVDEDYMEFMTDTLFSTISANQPFAFPDTREIARGASLADFIQPSLVQLQPNLDDFMDTLEPLQDLLYSKLPPVPEESQASDTLNLYRSLNNTSFLSDNSKSAAAAAAAGYQAPSPPSQYYHSHYPTSHKQRNYASASSYSMPPQYQQLSPPPVAQRTSPSPPQEYILPTPHPPPPTPPIYSRMPSRSNSLPVGSTLPMIVRREDDMFAVPKVKTFSRSRSGSCLSAQMTKPAPLVSASSDPQLSVPSNTPSALLAHLLTTNSSASQAYGQQSVSGYGNEAMKMSGSMPSLESYYKQTDKVPEKTSHRSVIYSPQSDNRTLNLSVSRGQVDARMTQTSSYEPTFSLGTAGGGGSGGGGSSGGGGGQKQKPSAVTILPHRSSLLQPQLSPSHQPLTSNVISSASSSPKHPDSPSASECLSLSPLNVASPSNTPQSPTTGVYKEHRRVSHINAEQKRRCNIKNGFDTLHSLIPQLSQNPNAKLSKAAMLHKGADYIRQLRSERQTLKEEIDSLKQQVESLNSAISNCQAMLPATGAPVSRQRSTKMREMYDEYVRVRTQENWKFWILSLLCEPLLASFNAQVSTHSLDDLYRTTLNWVDQHCTLSVLRPLVLNALRQLCTTTDILSDPARLPAEARAAASKGRRHSSS